MSERSVRPYGRALVDGRLERLELQPDGALLSAAGRIAEEAAVTWLPPVEPRMMSPTPSRL